jgi:DNA-binding response OmpR family regulator
MPGARRHFRPAAGADLIVAVAHSGAKWQGVGLGVQILVVEDDRDLRRFLSKAFREEGYGVAEAESGDRALERALDGTYHCIVLDVMLPGRDGFSVVAELRQRRVHTPVLMLTAKDELESRVRGLEAGADDYLTKPFDLSELIARVHALIRRAKLRHTDATLTVGSLVLDPLTRRVTHDGRVVDLSPREFARLEFLMRNAGRTVSRSRIAEAVWNYKFDPETNVVDVYVNYLRKKLTFAGQSPPIRTARGIGYRLDTP